MKITTVTNKDTKPGYHVFRALTETADFNSIAQLVERQVQRKTNIRGFRPGKVPIEVVRERCAEQINEEVYRRLVNQARDQIIKESDWVLAGQPKVLDFQKNPDSEKGVHFDIAFPYMPSRKNIVHSGLDIRLPQNTAKKGVKPEDCHKVLAAMGFHTHEPYPKNQKPQSGDYANITLNYKHTKTKSKQKREKYWQHPLPNKGTLTLGVDAAKSCPSLPPSLAQYLSEWILKQQVAGSCQLEHSWPMPVSIGKTQCATSTSVRLQVLELGRRIKIADLSVEEFKTSKNPYTVQMIKTLTSQITSNQEYAHEADCLMQTMLALLDKNQNLHVPDSSVHERMQSVLEVLKELATGKHGHPPQGSWLAKQTDLTTPKAMGFLYSLSEFFERSLHIMSCVLQNWNDENIRHSKATNPDQGYATVLANSIYTTFGFHPASPGEFALMELVLNKLLRDYNNNKASNGTPKPLRDLKSFLIDPPRNLLEQ